MILYPRLPWAFLRFSSLVDASLSRIHVHASVGTYIVNRLWLIFVYFNSPSWHTLAALFGIRKELWYNKRIHFDPFLSLNKKREKMTYGAINKFFSFHL